MCQSILVLRFPGHAELASSRWECSFLWVPEDLSRELHRQASLWASQLNTGTYSTRDSMTLPCLIVMLLRKATRSNYLTLCDSLTSSNEWASSLAEVTRSFVWFPPSLSLTQKVGVLVKHACTCTTLHSFTKKLVWHKSCHIVVFRCASISRTHSGKSVSE